VQSPPIQNVHYYQHNECMLDHAGEMLVLISSAVTIATFALSLLGLLKSLRLHSKRDSYLFGAYLLVIVIVYVAISSHIAIAKNC
jgi:hypothetical protein